MTVKSLMIVGTFITIRSKKSHSLYTFADVKPQTTLFPQDFVDTMRLLLGEAECSQLLSAMAEEPSVSVRLNAAKCTGHTPIGERVPWCGQGYYLKERPQFTFDPLLHAGWYYVQEASSMFLSQVIAQYIQEPVAMLDMCAAPGGKSTLLLDALPKGSVLFCNEPVTQRASILAENMAKWGRAETVVTCNTPDDYARAGLTFDAMLCDVPCSGEGMFRKDEGARAEWSLQAVERCCTRQREIVSKAWQCLKPGGLLVYSTCTMNTRENEENVAWICSELGGEPLTVETETAWGVAGSLSAAYKGLAYRFLPGKAKGEGLFMAAIRKTDGQTATQHAGKRRSDRKGMPSPTKTGREWLSQPDGYDFFCFNQNIIATPHALTPLFEVASTKLQMIHAGITIGREKGRDIVPAASLALSTGLRREAFGCAELNYNDAIAYLRREPLVLQESTPRGIVLLTYKGAALGFAKNIGSRANNLYPQEWRIRSTHAPNEDARPMVICME